MSAATMIPARPTTYKGIAMRSRLEARYAASLDARPGFCDRWEYEPRAFANESGQYLPDFLLVMTDLTILGPVTYHRYVEVRPTEARAMEAMPWMQIIWDSEPYAVLVVVGAGVGSWVAYGADPERKWRFTDWTPV